MIETFISGGFIMWPMLIVAVGIIWLAARTARGLRQDSPVEKVRRTQNSILFWGGMALLLGVLGTVVGLVSMARAIQMAGEVSSSLVWGGVSVSLVSVIFGIVILLLAGVLWLALDQWGARKARA